jgi:hypothetical protein
MEGALITFLVLGFVLTCCCTTAYLYKRSLDTIIGTSSNLKDASKNISSSTPGSASWDLSLQNLLNSPGRNAAKQPKVRGAMVYDLTTKFDNEL